MQQNWYKSGLFCAGLFFFFSLTAFSAEVPGIRQFYPAGYFSTPPVIDGKVSGDPVWEKVLAEEDFFKLGTKEAAKKKTSLRVGYGKKALYFGVICSEPDMDKVKAQLKDNEAIWREDGIEVFIFPSKGTDYFQFVVNTAGARLNLKNTTLFPLWDWQVKIFKGERFYSAEFEVPFTVLGKKPQKGEKWLFNVGRNTLTPGSDRTTTWAYLKSNRFHEPKDFGVILFTGLPLERVKAEKILISELWKEIKGFISYYKKAGDPVLSREMQSLFRKIGRCAVAEEVKRINLLTPEERAALKDDLKSLSLILPSRIEELQIQTKKQTEKLKIDSLKDSFFNP